MLKKFKIIYVIIILTASPCMLAAEELFFTYAGVTAGWGIDNIEYKDWFADEAETRTRKCSGTYLTGGAILNIFVNQFIGEFSLEYINIFNDEVPVSHMIYSATGKYSYQVIELLALTAGAGLYLETPPASRSYNSGGGINGAIGSVYNIDRELKIIFDLTARYGSFGVGEDSTRYSYGAKLGIVYKVGRI